MIVKVNGVFIKCFFASDIGKFDSSEAGITKALSPSTSEIRTGLATICC